MLPFRWTLQRCGSLVASMPSDPAKLEENYDRFIEEIRASGFVWGLRSDDGWAFCESNEYEETDVLVFWSDRVLAEKHVCEDWRKHVPVVIPLEEFIDQWLSGMHEDRALVGPNWDEGLNGLEIEPEDLAADLRSEEEPEA